MGRKLKKGAMPMKPLNCLTLFLESGKRFKLPSGETFDQLRQPPQSSTSSTASTSPESPTPVASTSIRTSNLSHSQPETGRAIQPAGLATTAPERREDGALQRPPISSNSASQPTAAPTRTPSPGSDSDSHKDSGASGAAGSQAGLNMQPPSSTSLYPVRQEELRQPNPLAPGYVGTHSPPVPYKTCRHPPPESKGGGLIP